MQNFKFPMMIARVVVKRKIMSHFIKCSRNRGKRPDQWVIAAKKRVPNIRHLMSKDFALKKKVICLELAMVS